MKHSVVRAQRRSAEHGFTPVRRSAEHGFTPVRRSAEHGFTLVEVMVALMIFGMIAGAGVAILAFSVRAQEGTARALSDVGGVERLHALLTADLGQAVDRTTRDERGDRRPAFTGGTNAPALMQLVRGGWTNIGDAPRASLQKVEYRLDGGALVRTGYPSLDGAAPLPAAVMVEDVASAGMRFRYAGAWSDRWPPEGSTGATLPQAAELTMLVGGGRQQRRYRMLFLVGADTPAARAVGQPAGAPVGGAGAPPPSAAGGVNGAR